ncbi:NUDIX domain-containing protein [Allosalinactinospora lopnorensis]|uniref:NUDIX domain-containing protein n=1 Tax=Allosalinactinospora lopnorensis TaxID=1352348 RepID=UPI00373FD9CC
MEVPREREHSKPVGRRIDYLNDPAAPKANSIVPSVNVAVFNEAGNLLMIRRADNGNWALPGGAMDPGERQAYAHPLRHRSARGARDACAGAAGRCARTPSGGRA